MAERLVCVTPADVLQQSVLVDRWDPADRRLYTPSYLIGSRKVDMVPVMTLEPQGGRKLRQVRCMRWGITVAWTPKHIRHARAETITQKASFRDLLSQRCLILCDGRVYYFRNTSTERPMALAGLYTETSPGELNFVIISVASPLSYAFIGGRVPVALDYTVWNIWLSRDFQISTALPLLKPQSDIEWYEVALNLRGNPMNSPDLIFRHPGVPLNPNDSSSPPPQPHAGSSPIRKLSSGSPPSQPRQQLSPRSGGSSAATQHAPLEMIDLTSAAAAVTPMTEEGPEETSSSSSPQSLPSSSSSPSGSSPGSSPRSSRGAKRGMRKLEDAPLLTSSRSSTSNPTPSFPSGRSAASRSGANGSNNASSRKRKKDCIA